MGKKKKDRKGKGAEKTAMKTERKAEKKTKKMVKEQGEEDIEALIAQFKDEDRKRVEVVEERNGPPSPRCNMSLVAHPDRDELIMFGGQYCNGAKTSMYNDMYVYNIRSNEWTQVFVPNPPPPRCAHQAVIVRQFGGQMWIFGGEFESPKQIQFYHYNDLWVFHMKERKWEKVNAKGGPSPRSGHRMVACKRQIIVFGGFYDVGDYKYFNDVHAFNMDTYKWTKIEPSGITPSPRSGCLMSLLQDQNKILIYGGYTREKIKKEVDQGKTLTDMFLLVPEGKDKDEIAPTKWKWTSQKQSGVKPTGRCGLSIVPTPGNRAIVFGGVVDEEEDEEHMTGVFYNDMYSLELDKGKWHQVELRDKREKERKKRRRKKSMSEDDHEVIEEEDDDIEDEVKRLKVSEPQVTSDDGIFQVTSNPVTTYDDGIFTVTVGGATSAADDDVVEKCTNDANPDVFWPSGRMNTLMAVKNGVLYLYGGMCEEGDKQYTLSDFYTLDLHKLDEWKILIKNDIDKQEWLESASEDDSDDDDDEEDEEEEGSDEESDEEELGEAPSLKPDEELDGYWSRNKDYWMIKADDTAQKEGLDVTAKQLKKAARKMAEEFYNEQKKTFK